MNWISCKGELPGYGEPVLIVISSVTQHITYCLDGADEVPDWFEPYHLEHDDELKVWHNNVSHWIYVDDLPKPPKRML